MTLKVLCARSMTTAVNALAGDFTRASGRRLDITFGTVGALQAKLAAGEIADVLILGAPAIADLERTGAVVAGSRRDIARTSIGVAVPAGAPAPDIATPEAFKQALAAARAVAFSDPGVGGSAGVHLAALWGRMGMAEEIARKGMPQKSGGEVAARVAEGRADIGLTLIAEIVPVRGARVIGKFRRRSATTRPMPPGFPQAAAIGRPPPYLSPPSSIPSRARFGPRPDSIAPCEGPLAPPVVHRDDLLRVTPSGDRILIVNFGGTSFLLSQA
jgi:molybdate transport system substrate-binding protein